MSKSMLLFATLAAMAGVSFADVEPDPRVAEARAIVKAFATSLQGELQTAIKEGGPVNAVEVCHSRAPQIAAELGQQHGWAVGRTSLKRRSPSNDPDTWETQVMQDFEARKAAGEDPSKLEYAAVVERDGRSSFRYMKAIPTQPVCLACHGGGAVSAEVEAKLQQYYPDDQARGFSEGDLRGAFTLSRDQ